MGKYLKLFENHSDYETYIASSDKVLPNVSYCEDNQDVHYNPYIKPLFCKLTLNDNSIVEIEGSGDLTRAMTSGYNSTTVSAEIGTLCTSISNDVFFGFTQLTSVTISDSVISIGNKGFRNCSGLTSVDIPNGVTSIGASAFTGCKSITSITIPDSVRSIGNDVFSSCSKLESLTIPNGVTSIGNFMFSYCTSLTSVTIPNSVTSIGSYAFNHCERLPSITIPSNVMSIDKEAFFSCASLANITSLAATAPTIVNDTFMFIKANGTLYVPAGSTGYDTWMQSSSYYLGYSNWTKVEQ